MKSRARVDAGALVSPVYGLVKSVPSRPKGKLTASCGSAETTTLARGASGRAVLILSSRTGIGRRVAPAVGATRSRADVGVAVGGRIIGAVEHVLNVELYPDVLIEPVKEGGIDPDETRDAHRVVGRGEDLVAINDAEPGAPLLAEVIPVPQRQRVTRQLRQPGAGGDGGRLRRQDPAFLVGVAARDAPVFREAAGQAELNALGALAVH